LRAAGVAYDVRQAHPYYFYDDLDKNTWDLINKIGIKDYQYNEELDYIYQK
jgi:hypothetical protein